MIRSLMGYDYVVGKTRRILRPRRVIYLHLSAAKSQLSFEIFLEKTNRSCLSIMSNVFRLDAHSTRMYLMGTII